MGFFCIGPHCGRVIGDEESLHIVAGQLLYDWVANYTGLTFCSPECLVEWAEGHTAVDDLLVSLRTTRRAS